MKVVLPKQTLPIALTLLRKQQKNKIMKAIRLNILMVFLAISKIVMAQHGVSSGSVTLLKSNGLNSKNERGKLNEQMVIVEDFMNFHKHEINIPTTKELELSIDFNNNELDNKNEFILQIGLATKEIKDRQPENAVNVALVIDKSGSMSGGKLEKVKAAMKKYIDGLDENDYLAIITFDNKAQTVLASAQLKNNKSKIYNLIDGIYVGGSTNINDGMILGYQEALKHHSAHINSRVILLTDGMTNSGETNHEKIISHSRYYNDKGIDISTIGVGEQLDFDLLKEIANAGNGSNYFIGDSEEDIQKVFIDELQSLLFQIGKKPEMTIKLPKNYKIKEFYGYNPNFLNDNEVSVNIENLNAAITQVFILKVEKINDTDNKIEVTLDYLKNGEKITEVKTKTYQAKLSDTNKEVKKNYQLALIATNLKTAAREIVKNNLKSGSDLINQSLSYLKSKADLKDKDIHRLYDIMKDYQTSLSKF